MPFLGGGLGSSEMIIFATIALLLFGKRLPEVARSVGASLMEFKKGMQGIQEDVNRPGHSAPPAHTDTAASRPPVDDEQDSMSAPRFQPPA